MKRDYNLELKDNKVRKYAYNFDLDVMHPFILRSFETFFKKGNFLELGSSKGDFTKRLTQYADDITCVEASSDAINEAKNKLNEFKNIKFHNSLFEDVVLTDKEIFET